MAFSWFGDVGSLFPCRLKNEPIQRITQRSPSPPSISSRIEATGTSPAQKDDNPGDRKIVESGNTAGFGPVNSPASSSGQGRVLSAV